MNLPRGEVDQRFQRSKGLVELIFRQMGGLE